MITILVTIIHVFVCIALILIVLLQAGKGAEMGMSFGSGASQALLGASGDTPMIGKITTAIAVIFMLTSLSLAYMSGHPKNKSVMDKANIIKEQIKVNSDEVKKSNQNNVVKPDVEAKHQGAASTHTETVKPAQSEVEKTESK